MENLNYKELIKGMHPIKRLGQNFLINNGVAKTEANFGIDRTVIELGPGFGMLTKELCKVAERVLSIEKDRRLYEFLEENIKSRKLELVNEDFFKVRSAKLKGADIMISNIPYNLSSKVIGWLGSAQMPGVLCLQKEFVNHMLAKPPSDNYSKLSVFCGLQFNITYIMDIPQNNFYPEPKVGSALVYLKPKKLKIKKKSMEVLSFLMMHKKKKLRNALLDSVRLIGVDKESVAAIIPGIPNVDKRPFQLSPEQLLEISDYISKELDKK